MNWSAYATYVGFAIMLVLVPGADFAVVTRNALVGGAARGRSCAAGVACSNATQGIAAATGLGVIIVRVQPLFETIRWLGIGYLILLAVRALRSAVRGEYAADDEGATGTGRWGGFRQGYLSNITNPKVLVFYLAVLPQFLGPDTPIVVLATFALTHAVLGLLYLSTLVAFVSRARRFFTRRVRRGMDVATGVALLGFGARLAVERT